MSIDEMEGVVHEVDTSEDIRANFQLLERAVAQFDTRFTLRAIRAISSLRKKLPDTKIAALDVAKKPVKEILAEAEQLLAKNGQPKKEAVPEVEVYIGILIQASLVNMILYIHC
jgi:26S proteasome regulatory subunit N3